MLLFRLLGGISLRDADGREVDALLRQPKHVSLLAYLALPVPGTWHRRDAILGMLWPEVEQSRARAALRSALYTLRGHLPDGAISARGDDELSIDASLIGTDVAAMASDFAAGRYEEALRQYQGELLPGIFIADAPAFEQWLDLKRRQMRGVAQKAAAHLADRLTSEGDIARATDAARRASELDPDDEPAARRWIALLDQGGDRAQAFAVYERFRAHIAESFGVRPSAETVALLDAVRTRRVAAAPSGSADPPTGPAQQHASIAATPSAAPQRTRAGSTHWRWLWAAAPIVIGLAGWAAAWSPPDEARPSTDRSLFVLPMVNETGDAALAYIATGIAEGVAKRLDDIGGLDVRSGARSTLTNATPDGVLAVARRFSPTHLLRSSVRRSGDSLAVHAVIIDASILEERALRVHRFPVADIRDVESRLAADIAGTVFRVAMPAVPRRPVRAIDPESYRLMLEGWHQLLSNVEPTAPGQPTGRQRAAALFQRAVNIDPLNARAWSGLSSAWAYQTNTDEIGFEDGFQRATAAARHAIDLDSLEGSAWANLGIMLAFQQRDLDVGLEHLRKAEAAEPSNAEIFMIKQVLLSTARRYEEARDAARFARQLDPLGVTYLNHEASSELCAGREDAAITLYAGELAVSPGERLARTGLTRSLARAGRYDEAIASWIEGARAAGDTGLVTALSNARGREGYWSVRHAEGRKRLAALSRQAGRVAPLRVVHAAFASGDTVAALAAVERAMAVNTIGLIRLGCAPDLDEYRGTPLVARILERVGGLRGGK